MKVGKAYLVFTQGIIQIIVIAYLGYKLGSDWWLESDMYGALFAGIGTIFGIIIMIVNLVRLGGKDDK